MTNEQKTQVIKIIKKDCKIRHLYFNEGNENETCAIGALAREAGFSKDDFSIYNNYCINRLVLSDICKKITEKFGLSILNLVIIQKINDENPKREARRKNIITYIKNNCN